MLLALVPTVATLKAFVPDVLPADPGLVQLPAPQIVRNVRFDFSRVDHDAPRRRLALVYWSSAEGRWLRERGAGVQGWTELHVVGEALFGPSPWRRSCVLPVYGRLGSVEAAVAALRPPSPSFEYVFEFELAEGPRGGSFRVAYVRGLWDSIEAAYWEAVDAR